MKNKYLTPECEKCEHLIVRYGFCQVVRDWVNNKIKGRRG